MKKNFKNIQKQKVINATADDAFALQTDRQTDKQTDGEL